MPVFSFSTVLMHGVAIAGKMYSNEEYAPFRPKDYENGSFEDTETYQTSSDTLWRSIQLRVRILWVLLGFSLVFNAFILLRDIRILHTHDVEEDSFGAGFQTDFSKLLIQNSWLCTSNHKLAIEAARSAIKTHRVLFEGSPRFHPNGTMYYPGPAHNQPRYIGEPSQEIDDNWEALTKGRPLCRAKSRVLLTVYSEILGIVWGRSHRDVWCRRVSKVLGSYNSRLYCWVRKNRDTKGLYET